MALTNDAKHVMLDALAAVALRVSIHTADPGAAGTNAEVTGGTYARQAVTWNAASGGNLDSSNQPVFNIPSGNTITHFGLWNTAGTTHYGSNALSASEAFSSDGTYTLTDLDITLT